MNLFENAMGSQFLPSSVKMEEESTLSSGLKKNLELLGQPQLPFGFSKLLSPFPTSMADPFAMKNLGEMFPSPSPKEDLSNLLGLKLLQQTGPLISNNLMPSDTFVPQLRQTNEILKANVARSQLENHIIKEKIKALQLKCAAKKEITENEASCSQDSASVSDNKKSCPRIRKKRRPSDQVFRLYKCPYKKCTRSYAAEYSLLRHIHGKHTDLWEKKYNYKKTEKSE